MGALSCPSAFPWPGDMAREALTPGSSFAASKGKYRAGEPNWCNQVDLVAYLEISPWQGTVGVWL